MKNNITHEDYYIYYIMYEKFKLLHFNRSFWSFMKWSCMKIQIISIHSNQFNLFHFLFKKLFN